MNKITNYFELKWGTVTSGQVKWWSPMLLFECTCTSSWNGERQHHAEEAEEGSTTQEEEEQAALPTTRGERKPPKGEEDRSRPRSTTQKNEVKQLAAPPKGRKFQQHRSQERGEAAPTPKKEGTGNHRFTFTYLVLPDLVSISHMICIWFHLKFLNGERQHHAEDGRKAAPPKRRRKGKLHRRLKRERKPPKRGRGEEHLR